MLAQTPRCNPLDHPADPDSRLGKRKRQMPQATVALHPRDGQPEKKPLQPYRHAAVIFALPLTGDAAATLTDADPSEKARLRPGSARSSLQKPMLVPVPTPAPLQARVTLPAF